MGAVVQALRPEGGSNGASPSLGLRVLLIVEPGTPAVLPTAANWGKHRLTVDSRGIAGVPATSPPLLQADAIIVEVDPEDPVSLAELTGFISETAAGVPVIAAVRDLTVPATRLALRSGAVDVLPLAFSPEELDGAVGPAHVIRSASATPAARGKVVAFLGATGGCGTTTLAVQTGIAWAATQRVCLLDLDLQFGNAALYLDLGTQLGLGDVLDAGNRLDVDLLRNIAQTHGSGLSIVAAPADIMPLDTLSPEMVDKIVALAAQAYDVVIVDLPCAWTTWTMRVVEIADATMMIAGLTVPGIYQARRQAEIIAANNMAERLRLVLNRVAYPMFGTLDLSETQSLLGRRIDFTVANDYPTVSTAIDRGKSLGAIKAKSRVEKDLKTIVATLSAALTTAATVSA